MTSYVCATCGEEHDDLPDISADRPLQWWLLSEEERHNIELTDDTCIVRVEGEESFYIRGVIEIPIVETDDHFGFGVWVSQRKENFQTYGDNFDSSEIGPFFGWLSTKISYYDEDTMYLKTMAHFRGEGLRPTIDLEQSGHPLSLAQRDGITLDEAWKIVHFYMDKE